MAHPSTDVPRPTPPGVRLLRMALGPLTGSANARFADASGLAHLFPEYRIGRLVRRGGFGAVYQAEHRKLKRAVALKMLIPPSEREATALGRFEREVEVAGALDDPGIVRTFDAGDRGDVWFLAMEWLDGADLGALVERIGRLPVPAACEIARQAALALHHAHERGLVHRDVKPGNIMVTRGRTPPVKVLDFGVARAASAGGLGIELTATGEFVGTLSYAAPEQITAPAAVDARTDVFGLGATLYHLLAGQPPRADLQHGASLVDKVLKLAHQPIPSIGTVRPELPAELVMLVDSMVTSAAAERPETCEQVAQALTPFCEDADVLALLPSLELAGAERVNEVALPRRGTNSWPGWLAAAAMLASLVALGFGVWHKDRRGRPAAPPQVAEKAAPPAAPTILAPGWKLGLAREIPGGVRGARYSADNRYAFFCGEDGAIRRYEFATDAIAKVVPDAGARNVAASYGGRYLAWTMQDARAVIGRAEGTPPRRLADLPGLPAWQANLGSLAFIRRGWRGPTPILPDDVIAVVTGTAKGIWRFRCDRDEPPVQIVENLELLDEPAAVIGTMQAVFIANRPAATGVSGPERRILRLWGTRLAGCRLDRSIGDPVGITAAGNDGGLYVLDAGAPADAGRRAVVLELKTLSQPGEFAVSEIAAGFAGVTVQGVDSTEAGARLLVTDEGAGTLYEFRRE